MYNMKFHHLFNLEYVYTLNIHLAWFQFIEDSAVSWKVFKFQWEKAEMYVYFRMTRTSPFSESGLQG